MHTEKWRRRIIAVVTAALLLTGTIGTNLSFAGTADSSTIGQNLRDEKKAKEMESQRAQMMNLQPKSISQNSQHMWYQYNGQGNIDIRGYDNGNVVQTTYNDAGYYTALLCDGDKDTLNFQDNGTPVNHSSGLSVTPNVFFNGDGSYAIVSYTVKNDSTQSKTYSLGVNADVDIKSDDYASVYTTNSGLKMVGENSNLDYYLVCKNLRGITDVDTLWLGYYRDRDSNQFQNASITELTDTDSGFAFSWKDRTLAVGESVTYYYEIGIGESGSIVEPSNSLISMSDSQITVEEDSACFITANVKMDSDDSFDLKRNLVWTSSDESVLNFLECKIIESAEIPNEVSAIAKFQTLKEGISVVTVQLGSEKKTCSVTVKKEENVVKGDSSGFPSSNLKIGSNVEFTLPSDVPLIGNGTVSLDFDNIPIQFEQKDNTYRLGINVTDLNEFSEEGWASFKKFVDSQKESYRKGINALLASKYGVASMGMDVKPDIECYGYAEGTIGKDGVQSIGGKMMIQIKVKAKKEWQTTVVMVPVVIKFSGEVGVKRSAAIGLDFGNKSVYCEDGLEINLPKLTISGGVGVAYIADISVYGSAYNKINIENSVKSANKELHVTGEINGTAGVSAKAFCFEYQKELLKGDGWTYYDSRQNGGNGGGGGGAFSLAKNIRLSKDDWIIERAGTSAWKGTKATPVARTSTTSGEIKTLQSDIYDDAKPYLVQTENGKKVLVYTTDIASRIKGNHTAIVYSIFNESTGVWSNPNIIDDDGTGDYYPSITIKGETIYVAWTNASGAFTTTEDGKDNFPMQLATACEIEVASLDLSTSKTKVKTKRLTWNETLDCYPSIYNEEGRIFLAWINNDRNDILEMGGTNKIYMASLENGSWNTEEIVSEAFPIQSLAIGSLHGEEYPIVAYTLDKSNSTSQNISLYMVDASGKKKLIKNNSFCANPIFGKIGNKNVLTWYDEEDGRSAILYMTELESEAKKLCDGELAVTQDYQIIDGDDGQTLLVCASAKEDKDGSDIAAYIIGGSTSSQQVSLTNMEGYAVNPTGIYDWDSDSWNLAFLRRDVTISQSKVDEKTDLCITSIIPESRLELGNLEFIDEKMMPGATEEIVLSLSNNGLKDCGSYMVRIMDGSTVISETTVNAGLKAGESKEMAIEVSLPMSMNKNTNYTIQAVPKDGSGRASLSQNVTVGQVDTELNVEEKGDKYIVKARNITGFSTTARLIVRNTDASGVQLFSYDLGNLEPYGKIEKELSKETLAANGADYLYLKLDSGSKELFDSNNEAYLYVGTDVMASLERISASKSKIDYKVGERLELGDLKVNAIYSDGTKKTVSSYKTNASTIDMTKAGRKQLDITYEENFTVRKVSVPITISEITAKPTTLAPVTIPSTNGNQPQNAAGNKAKTSASKVKKPRKVTLKKAKSTKRGTLKLTWKRDKKVTGYQAVVARDKKFKKSNKTAWVKKNKTVSKTFTKLKRGKTYFAKVRAYKKIGKKKVYGAYSKVKKAKIR